MRILVLARDHVDAARVRSALPGDELSDAEVLVVSPAEQESTLKFLMSDADDAIADASERGDHELGLVTLCIGGGQGIALLLQRP